MMKAAVQAKTEGICFPILLGNPDRLRRVAERLKLNLDGIELIDMRADQEQGRRATYAKHLAYIGSLNDDILDTEGLALELIGELKIIAPDKLMEKYSLTSLDKEPLALYDDICKRRGFLLRGGESDYTRCARAVIDDFRKQRIGKICLEERWK